jgi:hypothetical protein
MYSQGNSQARTARVGWHEGSAGWNDWCEGEVAAWPTLRWARITFSQTRMTVPKSRTAVRAVRTRVHDRTRPARRARGETHV